MVMMVSLAQVQERFVGPSPQIGATLLRSLVGVSLLIQLLVNCELSR